jgi:hypothetical protein
MGWQDRERTTTSPLVISNRAKVAAAAAKRRDKIASLKSQTSSGWVKDRVTKKGHPLIEELRQYMIDAVDTRNKPRDTEHIHPSEISKSDWCPRQTYYRISGVPHDEGYGRAGCTASPPPRGGPRDPRQSTMLRRWARSKEPGVPGVRALLVGPRPAVCARCVGAHRVPRGADVNGCPPHRTHRRVALRARRASSWR